VVPDKCLDRHKTRIIILLRTFLPESLNAGSQGRYLIPEEGMDIR